MTKLCGVKVYIAIYDQAVWCARCILLFMTKLCGVMMYILFMTKPCGVKVYIAIYDQVLWCEGVYCYL